MTFRQSILKRVHRTWETPGLVSTLLLPLAWCVALFVYLKRRRWQRKPPLRACNVPVIVVGNIMVGGTGKTPVVIELVNRLKTLGWNPGVISRGYRAKASGNSPQCGIAPLDPARFGDEPSLIAAATGVAVAVHPKRTLALSALMTRWPDINVVVSDDGLQHLAMARDLEIVVQDSRGLGNGRLLPAGPLREPRQRLESVDLVITNTSTTDTHEAVTNPYRHKSLPGLPPHVPHLRMQLQPVSCTHLQTGRVVPWLQWRQAHSEVETGAVAAIGQPERFFSMLRRQGLRLSDCVPLPDHDDFHHPPFKTMKSALILITDKDAVKCSTINDPRLWSVQVAPRFSDNNWVAQLLRPLKSRPSQPS